MKTVEIKSQVGFRQHAAVQRLEQLAQTPFDLAQEGNLTPIRLQQFSAEACGYRLLYGTERVDDEVMQALNALADEARVMDKMRQMQSGAIVNCIQNVPSENRSALHTATRDFFEHSQTAVAARSAAQQARMEVDKLKAFMSEIDSQSKYTDMICIGIGGSDLGPRAHFIALQHLLKNGRRIHFISNIDPDDAAAVLAGLDLNSTLVTVISKAGTTLETRSNEEFVRSYFQKSGLSTEKHFIAVTSKSSPMDDPKRYLTSFYIWDWVGGRYSTTSMVGGVMLSFAFGFDVYWELLRGANAMDKAALSDNRKENLPLLGALLSVWNRNFLKYPTLALIPYSQALQRYPAHIQQVEMESNGKHVDQNGAFVDFETGMIIWGEPGTNAQHSFYQLIHQGTDIIPLEFIGFKESQWQKDHVFSGTSQQQKLLANLFAQIIALAVGKKSENPNQEFRGNRPSHLLLAKKLTPYSLGALLGYFEHKVAFEGFVWGVNSFDQEGVQLGKVLATQVLERMANPKTSQPFPLGDLFLKQLDLV